MITLFDVAIDIPKNAVIDIKKQCKYVNITVNFNNFEIYGCAQNFKLKSGILYADLYIIRLEKDEIRFLYPAIAAYTNKLNSNELLISQISLILSKKKDFVYNLDNYFFNNTNREINS